MTTTSNTIRARLREHIEAGGISLADAARGIGMSAPAVSSWLGGKYRGDNERVAGLVGRWLDTERSIAETRTGILARHADLAVTLTVQTLAEHAQANADMVLAYGAAGGGKTHALERFCDARASAFYVAMSPAVTSVAVVLGRIADALDVGGGVTTAARLERAVVESLSNRNAVLVVDEAHHLSAALLDAVRCVHDMAGCGVVLAGNEPLWSRLASGERAAQLVSRVGVRRRFRSPSEADVLALAGTLLGRAPAGKGLQAVLDAGRGRGHLRAVVKLLAQAAVFASADGSDQVRDADLVEAAANMGIGS